MGVDDESSIITSDKSNLRKLRALYQSADCFVLPSCAEGFGLPILEAMACGVPPMVTNYSAPKDFVNKENGYLLNVERMIEANSNRHSVYSPPTQWGNYSKSRTLLVFSRLLASILFHFFMQRWSLPLTMEQVRYSEI